MFRGLGSIPARLADFVVGRPFLVVAVLLILTATAGFSARNLRFDFNPDAVFDNQSKVIKDAEQFNLDFGGNENVIIIGFVATGKSDVLSPAALTWQAETVHAFEHLPHVVRVESLISMETPHVTFSLPPKMTYEPIISETPVSPETADTLRERLAQTEMPFGSLVSKDEKMSAEMVVFDASQQEFDAMEAMVKNVDDTLAKFPVPDGYRAVVSGLPVLRVGIVRDLGKDQARLMPLAGILYLITLALAFRSLSGSLLPLFAVGQGLIWTFGVMAVWGQPLNIISNILPCMLLINGVSNSIHVLTRYSEEAVQPGVSRKDATSPHDPPDAGRVLGRVCHGGGRILRPADGQFPRAAELRQSSGHGSVVSLFDRDSDARRSLALLQAAGVPGFPRVARLFAGFGHGRQFLDPLALDDRRSLRGDRSSRTVAGADRRDQFLVARNVRRKQSDDSNPAPLGKSPLRAASARDQPEGRQAGSFLQARHLSQGRRTPAVRLATKADPVRAVVSRFL